jgi:Transposase DDE domain
MLHFDIHDLRDVFVYAMIDDYLKTCNHATSTGLSARGEPPKLTDAEVLFVFVVACLDFGGNCQQAMRAMKRARNITHALSRSQFNRRVHALQDRLCELLALLSTWAKAENHSFAIDSCPLPVCKNIRIRRCQLVQGEAFRGYNASKREYFYGYKVHLITAADGRIVEFDFTPGSVHDQIAFALLGFDFPPQSTIYADKAYNHYAQEELLAEAAQVAFEPIRRSNSRRADNDYCTNWVRQQARRHVETDIGELVDRWPRRIHAVTAKGFLLKVVGFILAHNILFYF